MSETKQIVKNPTCGIIMPISLIDNCPPEHWADVLGILKDICNANDFIPNLVSDADDIGVIQPWLVAHQPTSTLLARS